MRIYAVFAVLAGVAMVLALLPFRSMPGVTEEDFKLLQPGMTQAEVERALHGPVRNDLGHTAIIWMPRATGGRVSAWIEPASPAVEFIVREDRPKGGRQGLTITPADDFFPQSPSKEGRQGVWVTRTGLIAVYFGRDGKLQNKYSSTVDELVPPSLTHWIASRPGMIRRSLGF